MHGHAKHVHRIAGLAPEEQVVSVNDAVQLDLQQVKASVWIKARTSSLECHCIVTWLVLLSRFTGHARVCQTSVHET